jgi:predicted metalloprotease with PDZ domain
VEESSFDSWIKYYRQDENSINSQISYYDKGAILGLLLDLEIRKRSNGAIDSGIAEYAGTFGAECRGVEFRFLDQVLPPG